MDKNRVKRKIGDNIIYIRHVKLFKSRPKYAPDEDIDVMNIR